MAAEIERKFLVKQGTAFLKGFKSERIVQGYLHQQGLTSRVRIVNGVSAYLTLKGPKKGISCAEYEYPIPLADAQEMMVLCGKRCLTKTRYYVQHEGNEWHVDVYEGKLLGLVTAEIELPHQDKKFDHPDWVHIELTRKKGFSNKYLARHQRFPKKYRCQ